MRARGFTLVEVLVALVVVALGLAALSTAVSSTARSSTILREKMQAQWIALNRMAEVRLNLTRFGQNNDTAEIKFGNRTWHYDTRYFDTNVSTMKRVVIRVYAGEAKAKGNPLAETVGFTSTAFPTPAGQSNNIEWRTNSALAAGGGAVTNPNQQVTTPQQGVSPGNGTTTGTGGTPTPTQTQTPVSGSPTP